MRPDLEKLRGRFDECFPAAPDETRREIFDDMLGAYTRQDRHYHDLGHIQECLAELEAARKVAEDFCAVEIAIWFHDFIYDPHSKDNEQRSAEVAATALRRLEVDEARRQKVHRLILATRHTQPPMTPDEKLIMDIDLASLGCSAAEFDANGRAIRMEYPHISDADFRRGRRELLQRFLSRPRIYYTQAFYDRYETAARQNMRRSLQTLYSEAAAG